MERAMLWSSLFSLSSSALVSTRFFSHSAHRLARLPERHLLVLNVHHRSLLCRYIGLISSVSRPSLQLKGHLCSLSVRALATSSVPEILGIDNDVVEKLGFEEVSEEFIEECKSRAELYKHKKTGAEIMSLSNADENKVFGIAFRTPPKDSTGIPHILEHRVLCGSRKYPLKEPFAELLKGSLHTFLNAFTYPDRTCYSVASTNTKDFYNLVDAYLDAVFFPKCVEDIKTFQQEGRRCELNEPSEDITCKGVVFNEMKGVYSRPASILGRASQQALFPDNKYGVDSGGDPQVIPKLNFEEFKSGLGDAIVGGGVEDELLQPQFSVGLKSVSEDDIQKVKELILNTLKKLAEEGFHSDAVEASMNTIEFCLRENNIGSFPHGLALMLRSIGKWIYDMDPFVPLKYQEPLKALKARIAEEGSKAVFAPLIEKFILNNLDRVTIEMQPDSEKISRDEAAEEANLEKWKPACPLNKFALVKKLELQGIPTKDAVLIISTMILALDEIETCFSPILISRDETTKGLIARKVEIAKFKNDVRNSGDDNLALLRREYKKIYKDLEKKRVDLRFELEKVRRIEQINFTHQLEIFCNEIAKQHLQNMKDLSDHNTKINEVKNLRHAAKLFVSKYHAAKKIPKIYLKTSNLAA